MLHDLSSSRIRVTLLDGNGNVLLESNDGVDVTKMGNHSNRPEFINAMKKTDTAMTAENQKHSAMLHIIML